MEPTKTFVQRHRPWLGSLRTLATALILVILVFVPRTLLAEDLPVASFAAFDRKASAGEPCSVAFFGGSLTWGANASDPQLTSYRGRMMTYLRAKYSKCPFTFWDAAIGGTGSKLGMFRLQRDVLSRRPDLVFYDFTANDDLYSADASGLDSYETCLREMTSQGIPVVQAFLGFKFNFGDKYLKEGLPRVLAHQRLATAYGTATGNIFPLIQAKIDRKETTQNELWPFDGAHPDDGGYQLFFEAVRAGFDKAVAEGRTCRVPEKPVFGFSYHQRTRNILTQGKLAGGWTREKTYRTSAWFDGLSSRWMDDVACADIKNKSEIQALRVQFRGTFVGIFGEADQDGDHVAVGFRVKIDGHDVMFQPDPKVPATEVWATLNPAMKVRLFYWRVISETLAPGDHVLEITPVFPAGAAKAQLRIESVCSAGQ